MYIQLFKQHLLKDYVQGSLALGDTAVNKTEEVTLSHGGNRCYARKPFQMVIGGVKVK